jgi:hypothetical protein
MGACRKVSQRAGFEVDQHKSRAIIGWRFCRYQVLRLPFDFHLLDVVEQTKEQK